MDEIFTKGIRVFGFYRYICPDCDHDFSGYHIRRHLQESHNWSSVDVYSVESTL